MKILAASDSFKGSLSSARIIELLKTAAEPFGNAFEITGIPTADGGEGTLEALLTICGGEKKTIVVHDTLMRLAEASYGILPDRTAVIEMAAASGLTLVPEHLRNPLKTTTFGTGVQMLDALHAGCRKIILTVGGSATNDGGIGLLSALGVRFFSETGQIFPWTGESLEKIARIDRSGLNPALQECEIIALCDVQNPLLGPEGAAFTFAAQKGADADMQRRLERGMAHYADLAEAECGGSFRDCPGSGAAGGLGFALQCFLHAEMRSGIEEVLNLADFGRLLEGTDLVITGEGRMDWQSAFGKVPAGIGKRCQKAGVPAIAIVGAVGEGFEKIYDCGIRAVIPTVSACMPVEEAMDNAEILYLEAADRVFRLLQCAGR